MGQAGGAQGILPVVTVKPGEYIRRFSPDEAARCPLVAANFKGYARRVEKYMFMATVFAATISRAGYGCRAGTAEDGFFGGDFFPIPGFVFRFPCFPLLELKAIAGKRQRAGVSRYCNW